MKYVMAILACLALNVKAAEQPHIYTPHQCGILAFNALSVAKARDQGIPRDLVRQMSDDALTSAKNDPAAWATTDKNILEFLDLVDAIYAQPKAKPGMIYDAVYDSCMTTFKKAQS